MRILPLLLILTPISALASPKADAEAAVLAAPSDPYAWVALGDALGGSPKALDAYQQALALDPTNAAALAGIERNPDPAMKKLEKTVLKEPLNDEAWGDLGDAKAARGMRDAATEAYAHALTIDPHDSEWQQRLNEQGGPDAVLSIVSVAMPRDPTSDESLGDWGDVYRNLGDLDAACESYRAALALDAADTEWASQVEQCNFDSYQSGLGGGSAAVTSAEGGSDGGEIYLGVRMATSGDVLGGKNAMWGEVVSDPNDPTARSWYEAVSGERDVDVLAKLVGMFPTNDELWGDLGDARIAAGDRIGALEAYKKAAELDPADPEFPWRIKTLEAR